MLGAMATAGLVVLAIQQSPPTFEARASTLLLPPATSLEDGGNPFLYLGGLEQAVDVLTKYLDADTTREEIAETVPDASYTVMLDPTTSGPILVTEVEAASPAEAMNALRTVLDTIPRGLTELQTSVQVPAGAEIGSMNLAVDTSPEARSTGTLRAVVAAGGAGILMTLFLAAIIDGLMRRKGTRRRNRTHLPAHAEPAITEPPAGAAPDTKRATRPEPTRQNQTRTTPDQHPSNVRPGR
ncbi:hypothetical protein [Georgenia yuyongxinii]